MPRLLKQSEADAELESEVGIDARATEIPPPLSHKWPSEFKQPFLIRVSRGVCCWIVERIDTGTSPFKAVQMSSHPLESQAEQAARVILDNSLDLRFRDLKGYVFPSPIIRGVLDLRGSINIPKRLPICDHIVFTEEAPKVLGVRRHRKLDDNAMALFEDELGGIEWPEENEHENEHQHKQGA